MLSTLTEANVPVNFKSQIDQVVRGYETAPAKGLVHGLQKDAIQNSWGHKATSKGKGWGTKFEIVRNSKGVFLLIEDWGTTGMTGPNLNMNEFTDNMELPPDYKLARFSAMNYSGGNEGAGLFGRGKILFSAASQDYFYYFESLTEEEGYRANHKKLRGNNLVLMNKALEGKDAENYINKETGITPITRYGSRIIIVNPVSDIIQAIENGELLRNIEETWWQIILKYQADISVVSQGVTRKAKVPEIYLKAFNEADGWKSWKRDNIKVPRYHSFKKIHLYVSKEEIDEDLRGVFVYRKNMKIGEIPLEIPTKIRKKYFGVIEVDKEWEKDLEQIENLEHYGFTSKRVKCFQQLKSGVTAEHDNFMTELGLINRRKNTDQMLYEELTEITQNLDMFLNTLNIDRTGSIGKRKEPIKVVWQGIQFPNEDSKLVVEGDIIKDLNFTVQNNLGITMNVYYKLRILCKGKEITVLDEGEKQISGSSKNTFGPYNIKVKDPLIKYEKHEIELIVYRKGYKNEIKKKIDFYFDVNPPTRSKQNFLFSVNSVSFPNGENRRVNTGEKVTNLSYLIENQMSNKAYIAFHLSTHDPQDNNRLIESVLLKDDIVIDPYDSFIIDDLEIMFGEVYSSKILSGEIEIRARISASTDFANYEIADELASNKITISYNQDEKGIGQTFNQLQTINDPEERKRSDLMGSHGNWTFIFNAAHPAYLRIKDDEDSRKDYLEEEILKQIVRVQLKEGVYSIFSIDGVHEGDNFEDLTDSEIIEKLYLALDNLQYKRYQELNEV